MVDISATSAVALTVTAKDASIPLHTVVSQISTQSIVVSTLVGTITRQSDITQSAVSTITITAKNAIIGPAVEIVQVSAPNITITAKDSTIDSVLTIRQILPGSITYTALNCIPIYTSILSGSEFTIVPDMGLSVTNTPKTRISNLGDGYTVKTSNGLLNKNRSWDISFKNRPSSVIDTISAFLEDKAGYKSFVWIPPTEATSLRVVCSNWSVIRESEDQQSIVATFREVVI